MNPSPQTFSNPQGTFKLVVEDEPWKAIQDYCDAACTRETGGVLIGAYTESHRTAVVSLVTGPPPDSRAGRSWFRRGVSGLYELLRRQWNLPTRAFYLGEWHYHPARVIEPSTSDLAQMATITSSITYHCPEPLLLIVGMRLGSERPTRAFVFPQRGQSEELLRGGLSFPGDRSGGDGP